MTKSVHLDIPNLCNPAEGICTGGMPRPADLQKAKDQGVDTVVNLCSPGEMGYDEAAAVEGLGMRYVNIPITGAASLTEDSARQLAQTLGGEGAVLVHCASGNRVGALFALKAFYVDGLAPEAAVAAGRAAGLKALEPYVRQLLGA